MDGERVTAAEPSPATEVARAATPTTAPASVQGADVLTLQRWAGNRAVGRLLQRDVDPGIGLPVAEPLADTPTERQTDQKGISTPLPADAAKDPLDGAYYVTRGGANVEIMLDAHGGASTFTDWNWKFSTEPSFTTAGGKIDSVVGPVVKTWIQTTYQSGVSGSVTSAYGRGTTTEDQAAGNTSLRFHEGCHGQDYLDHMAANPMPTLSLAVGDPAKGAQKKVDTYIAAMRKWHKQGIDDSERKTDQVGTPGKHTH